jgi:hypothetical protein
MSPVKQNNSQTRGSAIMDNGNANVNKEGSMADDTVQDGTDENTDIQNTGDALGGNTTDQTGAVPGDGGDGGSDVDGDTGAGDGDAPDVPAPDAPEEDGGEDGGEAEG